MTEPHSPPKPDKKQVCQFLLQKGSAFVHLDPRKTNVRVPKHLASNVHVVLQFGYDLPVPIPDLTLDAFGIGGTLSFKGVPQEVFVPWSATFALIGDDVRGMVWADDFPPELSARALTIVSEKPASFEAPAILHDVLDLTAYRNRKKGTP